MENSRVLDLTKEILRNGYLLSLGICDDQGVWVADVIYTFDDAFNVYWMSKAGQRHSKAIDGAFPQVAGTITLTTGPDIADAGLQLAGRAERVESISEDSLTHYFHKRNKPLPLGVQEKISDPCWYKMTPSAIELIYKQEFGYKRQTVR